MMFKKNTIATVCCAMLLFSLGGNAQVTLLQEVKVTDSVMYFDGNSIDISSSYNNPNAYDYVYGNALTPHGDCIKAYKEFVYMTWYRGGKLDRHVMLTRYNMKTGAAKTIEFPHQHTGYNGKWWIGETHNTIAVGICPKDETIHLVYDMHRNGKVQEFIDNDDRLRYTYSIKGGAVVPDSAFTLENAFVNSPKGNYKHTSFHGINDASTTNMLTYPAFFTNDEGDLFLKNRHGYSANGKINFCMYNGTQWQGFTDFNKSNRGGGEVNGSSSTHNWGIYGDMKYFNGKIRIGFQQRLGNKSDKYQYQNGIYYAYSDDPSGKTQWKDYKGVGIPQTFYQPHLIKVAEPGDFVATTQKDMVYMVGGFDWVVTDNEDLHFVSQVKDKQNNVTKKLHTYKSADDYEFTTVQYNAGSELYAAGNDVYVIGLKNGRVNIVKTEGGTSNFKQVYQHTTGPTFDKGVVNVNDGKLYYYLKKSGGSGDKRTTYLQVFDLDIDTMPVDHSRDLSFKNLYNNQEIISGTNLSVEATVGSAFKEVSLWSGTINLGTKTEAPFVWSDHAVLTNMTETSYTFKLLAKDSSDVEVEKSITIKTKVPSSNVFTGEGQYKFYNPSKTKWMGADVATDDALVTDAGDAENNIFNVVANGAKFNIFTSDYAKVVVINSASGFTSMLADTTSEVLASDDALFSFTETGEGTELYYIASGADYKLNVKSNGSDIGRGTSELPNYQWQVNRIGDLAAGIANVTRLNTLHIYPNPANATVYIKGASISNAKVFTMSGQILRTYIVDANQIDVSQLERGLYILQLEDVKGQVSINRLIVE